MIKKVSNLLEIELVVQFNKVINKYNFDKKKRADRNYRKYKSMKYEQDVTVEMERTITFLTFIFQRTKTTCHH